MLNSSFSGWCELQGVMRGDKGRTTPQVTNHYHGLATFVHEQLEWSLVDQSPEQSETEWFCVDVAGHKMVNVYKPPGEWLTPTTIPTFPHHSQYVSDFNCQHVNWGYNTTPWTMRAWTPGQYPTTLHCCTTQRRPVSSLDVGTSAPNQTWPSQVSAKTANCRTDVSLESFCGHNIGPPS